VAGNAAEAAPRHAEAFKLPGVEAANDSLLTNLADFGRLASGEHGLHIEPPLSLVVVESRRACQDASHYSLGRVTAPRRSRITFRQHLANAKSRKLPR